MTEYEIFIKLTEKYAHEIKFQREMINDMREYTFAPDYDSGQWELKQCIFDEYTRMLFQLYAYEYEKLTGKLLQH